MFINSKVLICSLMLSLPGLVLADTTVKDDAKELAADTKRGTKKAVRAVKDKTCEMINGKMECAAHKVKHSLQNGADNVEDAID